MSIQYVFTSALTELHIEVKWHKISIMKFTECEILRSWAHECRGTRSRQIFTSKNTDE